MAYPFAYVILLFMQPLRIQWCPIGRLPALLEYVLPSKMSTCAMSIPFKCIVGSIYLWILVNVYNYITAAVILYIPASRNLLQSSELYCAISCWNPYCHCFRTLTRLWCTSSQRLNNKQFLTSLFTNHINMWKYVSKVSVIVLSSLC